MWPSFGRWRARSSAPPVLHARLDSATSRQLGERLDALRARLLSDMWDADYEVARAVENLTPRTRKTMRLDAVQAATAAARHELSRFVVAVADMVIAEGSGLGGPSATDEVVTLLSRAFEDMIMEENRRGLSGGKTLSQSILDALTPMDQFRKRLVAASRHRFKSLVKEGTVRVEQTAISVLAARTGR